MGNVSILSIKPVYAKQILAGTKTIELRKSSMALAARDVILVYSSTPDQQLAFWFRVRKIETLPVPEMWGRYADRLGIERADYDAYFAGGDEAVGLHIGEVHAIKPIPLEDIQRLVPGFVPPQGIIWLRDELGRYEKLFPSLSDPLPKDAFPQLAFDGLATRSRAG